MTENDPLEIIKSDERFLPQEKAQNTKSREETLTEHMFYELFERRWQNGKK